MDASILTLTATFVFVGAAVAFIAIANWPQGETPHRHLDDTPELSPLERL